MTVDEEAHFPLCPYPQRPAASFAGRGPHSPLGGVSHPRALSHGRASVPSAQPWQPYLHMQCLLATGSRTRDAAACPATHTHTRTHPKRKPIAILMVWTLPFDILPTSVTGCVGAATRHTQPSTGKGSSLMGFLENPSQSSM